MLFGKGEEYGVQSNDERPVNRNAHCKSGIGWLLDSKGWCTWIAMKCQASPHSSQGVDSCVSGYLA